ncbi:hypothetical protein ES703_15021 [subsurface metagenome]
MSLQDWVKHGWLKEHTSSRQEISDLLGLVARDLQACRTQALSLDWRFTIAYNAALQAATVALRAVGFRTIHSSHHYYTIESLSLTLALDSKLVHRLHAFSKKRSISSYDTTGTISDREFEEMVDMAEDLRQRVEEWLKANHPELLED